MRNLGRALIAAAGVFALSATALAAGNVLPVFSGQLTSFGNTKGIAASPFAYSALGGQVTSVALSPTLTLDFGRNINVVSQFSAMDPATTSGLLGSISPVSAATLADGGNYSAVTWMGDNNFNFRTGFAFRAPDLNAPTRGSFLVNGPAGTSVNALMGTLNWNFADWGGANVTAVTAREDASFTGSTANKAVGVSAYLGLGEGWVGSISYSESQLDLKPIAALPQSIVSSSYGLGIAKRGLFGDDTLGFSLFRPAPGQGTAAMIDAIGSANIPSLAIHNRVLSAPPDADLEVG